MTFMEIVKKTLGFIMTAAMWGVALFFLFATLAYFPGWAGVFSFLIVVITVPIPKLQKLIKKIAPRKWIKPALFVVLFIAMLSAVPTSPQTGEQPEVNQHIQKEEKTAQGESVTDIVESVPEQVEEDLDTSPEPTANPRPTASPKATASPKPTATPKPTPSPVAEVVPPTPVPASEIKTTDEAIAKERVDEASSGSEKKSQEDIYKGVNKKIKKLLVKTMEDEKLIKDFIQAANQINLDINKISRLERTEDWTAGPRYSFYYESNSFVVYCDTESKVILINSGLSNQIYKRGYEPYDINDYTVDTQVVTTLQGACRDIVKTQLNYPKTAKFSLLDWGVSREKDVYYLSSNVTAKNAFGVESEIPFSIAYRVIEEGYRPVYFAFNGVVIKNDLEETPEPERKAIEGFVEEHDIALDSGEFLVVYGELGEYGKTIELDGNEYIVYSVPAGTYKVVNKGLKSTLFVTSTKYFTNSSGFTENDVFETIYFQENGQEETITVLDGQQIEVSFHSKYVLKPEA